MAPQKKQRYGRKAPPSSVSSSSNSNSNSNSKSKSNIKFKNPGKIELAVAALLLTGKLKVDSIELFREASLVISLIGQYNTLMKSDPSNVDKLMSFMDQNGDTTMNDILEALRKKTGQM